MQTGQRQISTALLLSSQTRAAVTISSQRIVLNTPQVPLPGQLVAVIKMLVASFHTMSQPNSHQHVGEMRMRFSVRQSGWPPFVRSKFTCTRSKFFGSPKPSSPSGTTKMGMLEMYIAQATIRVSALITGPTT